MADIWKDTGDGRLEYVSTDDGAFESWMDEQEPNWNRTANTGTIEFWREIWEAAREVYFG